MGSIASGHPIDLVPDGAAHGMRVWAGTDEVSLEELMVSEAVTSAALLAFCAVMLIMLLMCSHHGWHASPGRPDRASCC